MVRLLVVLFALVAVCPAQTKTEDSCSGCHDQGAKLAKSAHAEVSCSTCHPKKETYPHPPGVAKPRCAECHPQVAGQFARSVHAEAARKGNTAAPDCGICHGDAHELVPARQPAFRRAEPETCGMCHSEIAEQYKTSVHGQAVARGDLSSPLCTDCHGEHSIQSPKVSTSPVHPAHIRETCASCHGDVRLARKFGMPADRIVSFDASFHGLAARAGSQSVANCASCHGTHSILASSDPKSTIHPKNLPETCGSCHPGAGQRFALGPIHLVEGRVEPQSIVWIREIYLVLIPLTIGLMILHNGGDWLRKVYALRLRASARPTRPAVAPPPRRELRMYPLERLQHGLLLVSFTLLVWTGFALKYPDQWWASPLVVWEHRWPVRGWLHRGAAVVMMVAAGLHLLTLLFSAALREHWMELLPRRRDITEGVQGLLYNLGLRRTRPYRSAHSYIEKAEYWAVAWGTVIMAITGIMLWANNLMLAWLPKEFLDAATAIHFYEAVLATLAIVVWHFYSIMLDPDVYPIDTAWLTGYSVRPGQSHSSEAQHNPTDREQHER